MWNRELFENHVKNVVDKGYIGYRHVFTLLRLLLERSWQKIRKFFAKKRKLSREAIMALKTGETVEMPESSPGSIASQIFDSWSMQTLPQIKEKKLARLELEKQKD